MTKIISFALMAVFCLLSTSSQAQRSRKKDHKKNQKEEEISIYDIDTLIQPVPRHRQLFYEKVDNLQTRADGNDGKVDGQITVTDDELYSQMLTQSIITGVDQIQVMIENLPFPETVRENAANQTRIGYLRDLEGLVNDYIKRRKPDPIYFKRRVTNFKQLLIAKHEDRSVEFVRENPNIYTLDNLDLIKNDAESRKFLLLEMGRREPEIMVKRLNDYAREAYAWQVIAPAAKLVPDEVYNYASSSNYRLANAVKNSKDPLTLTIVDIAEKSKKPLQAMPFLSDIFNKKLTIEEVDKITGDPDLFYKNLVRLKVENQKLGSNTYTDELQYRGLRYVREINDLHESPDPVRFKILTDLKPEELYFIMVYGQDEIYTSSFLGAFKRMVAQMGGEYTGQELLDKVHYDKFRTFIRMSAGYNTLNQFLATMSNANQTRLMDDFVKGLEDGKDDDLEDAVDVADAFGSITNDTMATFLKQKVKEGYERSYKKESAKGMKIYALLTTLFEGNNSSSPEVAKRQSEILNLPPINMVPITKLRGEDNIVYERVFFYGDADGRMSYNSFMNNFKDPMWKIEKGKYFTTISCEGENPITIFANLPLDEPQDEMAIGKLDDYLKSKNIQPTIYIHRGHSYHLPITLDRLAPNIRVVMLGSCGGYHNLANILDTSPDAHIISSKQTGAMAVNDPIIRNIENTLVAGKDIDWITSWTDLGNFFSDKPKDLTLFNDYIPPHKNLGAIFIKAYRRLSAQEESLDAGS